MKNYRVEFAIDVKTETSREACERAWELLTSPDAMLPIGTVIDTESGESEDVDLQEEYENAHPVRVTEEPSDMGRPYERCVKCGQETRCWFEGDMPLCRRCFDRSTLRELKALKKGNNNVRTT
jgi:ribosomal protein S14